MPLPQLTPVKWGIMATGKIANAMVRDAALVDGTKINAVGSRSIESAKSFAAVHGIPNIHATYEELANDPGVDLVYIATPHNSHFELINLCLEKGKHVLCEKPLVLNARQAQACTTLAREKGLFLMEALWTRFFPATQKVNHWVQQGRIGQLKNITADFSFAANYDPKGRLFNPTLAGGALLDLGVYPISLATLFLGTPEKIDGSARIGETGVDEEDLIRLEFAGGATAKLRCGLRENRPVLATLEGTQGSITIHERFHHPDRITLHSFGGETINETFPIHGAGYHYQIAAVSQSIREGNTEHPAVPLADTLCNLKIMDSLRHQWGLSYPDD